MNNLKLLIGAGFGSGLLPKAPGTWGSLFVLVPLYPIISYSPVFGVLIFALTSSLLTLYVSPACVKAWGEDPGKLVMDEWAGMSITFVSVTLTHTFWADFTVLGIGFVFFRFFDILKPLGIHQLQSLKGGFGILLDDILAGFYAFISLKVLIFLVPKLFGLA